VGIFAYAEALTIGSCRALVTEQADTYQLFDQHKQAHRNYETIIAKDLRAGDVLRFSNGQEFYFNHKLGKGFTTVVLAVREMQNGQPVGELLALRVPVSDKFLGQSRMNLKVRMFVDKFYDGYDLLVEKGVAVPKLHGHLSEEYNLVDLITSDMSVDLITSEMNGFDFFAHPEKFSGDLLQVAELALYDFAKSVAMFENIGDFKAEQLIYVVKENRWMLVDWTDNHVLLHTRAGGIIVQHHPFDTIFEKYLRESGHGSDRIVRQVTAREVKILKRIDAIIKAERGQKPTSIMGKFRKRLGI
jgi:hypothetical protein